MDDLKIILYVVVAIIWVVYNNYRKISEASKKRNLTQPPREPVTGPQKMDPPRPVSTSRPVREVIEKVLLLNDHWHYSDDVASR